MAQGLRLYKWQIASCLRIGLESDGPGSTSLLSSQIVCFFYKLKVHGSFVLSKSVGSIFSTTLKKFFFNLLLIYSVVLVSGI